MASKNCLPILYRYGTLRFRFLVHFSPFSNLDQDSSAIRTRTQMRIRIRITGYMRVPVPWQRVPGPWQPVPVSTEKIGRKPVPDLDTGTSYGSRYVSIIMGISRAYRYKNIESMVVNLQQYILFFIFTANLYTINTYWPSKYLKKTTV
jgi:hypothetical protein